MMDSADEGRSPKRQKFCDVGGQDNNVFAVDRISDLPESIIVHILNFLPMKSAVATSSLSKSWKLLWTEVTSFEFESRWWSDCQDFVEFVNLMLSKRKGSTIHKFCLICENLEFGSIWLTKWISEAVCRNVGIVDVAVLSKEDASHDFRYEIDLPDEFITCKTLEGLRLRGPFYIKVTLQVEVFLPKLINLELSLVHFRFDQASLRKLVHGCPVLKFFRWERKHWWTSLPVLNWSICSLSLKHLEINLRDEGGGVKFMYPTKRRYTLEIDAPALEKLVLTDRVSVEISIQGGSSINEVDLDVLCAKLSTNKDYQKSIVQLIHGLMKDVKILKLSERTVELLGLATSPVSTSSLWSTKANFERLTKLVVKLDYATRWKCLIDIIDRCTALETLEITHLVLGCPSEDEIRTRQWRDQLYDTAMRYRNVSRGSLSGLKRFSYKGRTGLEDEKMMLLYMVNPAILTKTVELDLCTDFNDPSPNFELTFSFF